MAERTHELFGCGGVADDGAGMRTDEEQAGEGEGRE